MSLFPCQQFSIYNPMSWQHNSQTLFECPLLLRHFYKASRQTLATLTWNALFHDSFLLYMLQPTYTQRMYEVSKCQDPPASGGATFSCIYTSSDRSQSSTLELKVLKYPITLSCNMIKDPITFMVQIPTCSWWQRISFPSSCVSHDFLPHTLPDVEHFEMFNVFSFLFFFAPALAHLRLPFETSNIHRVRMISYPSWFATPYVKHGPWLHYEAPGLKFQKTHVKMNLHQSMGS